MQCRKYNSALLRSQHLCESSLVILMEKISEFPGERKAGCLGKLFTPGLSPQIFFF